MMFLPSLGLKEHNWSKKIRLNTAQMESWIKKTPIIEIFLFSFLYILVQPKNIYFVGFNLENYQQMIDRI